MSIKVSKPQALLLNPEIKDDDQEADLGDLLLEVLSGDGTTIGNLSAREALCRSRVDNMYPVKYHKIPRQDRQIRQRLPLSVKK